MLGVSAGVAILRAKRLLVVNFSLFFQTQLNCRANHTQVMTTQLGGSALARTRHCRVRTNNQRGGILKSMEGELPERR
jgi:hypothetical protein